MTTDRTRLMVAVLISVLVHAAVATVGVSRWDTADHTARTSPPPPLDPTVKLGQETPRDARMAWIAYEDFQRLISPVKAPQEQPVTQRRVDPVDQAPLENDPTPPAPAPSPEAQPAPPTSPLDTLAPDGQTLATAAPPTPVAAQPPAPTVTARPTSAPKRPSESPIASPNDQPVRVRPGATLTGQGVEVATVVPQLSVVTRLTAVPRNVTATLRFDAKGKVVNATLSRSTGYADVDGPIIASLYEWTARGDRLADYPRGFTLDVELLLGN